jgi:hypothetical protein
MMMIDRRSLFVATCMLGGVLALSSSASAFWKRHTAAACHYSYYSNLSDDVNTGKPTANLLYDWAGTVYNYMARSQIFICNVEDTDRAMKENLNTLNVHAYDGSTSDSVYATACYNRYDTRGGGCGASASSGASVVGDVMLTPALTMWSSTYRYHFGYLQVTLPPDVYPAGGDTSSFNGFFIAAP